MTERKIKLPISASRKNVEVFRKEDPNFYKFLEETGRMIVIDK